MKFLLDVHISNQIASALRESGHDVMRVADVDRELADHRIMSLAVSEERILITEDSDFSDLIFAHDISPPPAVIFIRCRPYQQLQISKAVLVAADDLRLPNHIAVVTPETLRFSPSRK